MKLFLLLSLLSITLLGKCFYHYPEEDICSNCSKNFLQDYRKIKSEEWKTSTYLNFKTEELNKIITELMLKKDKTKDDKKQLIISKMLLYSNKINKINKNDAENIKKWLKILKIDNLDNIEKIYNDKNFSYKFRKLVNFLRKNNSTTPNVQKRPWNYLGPYIESYKFLCQEKLSYYRSYKKIMTSKNLKCNFNKNAFKNLTIEKLLIKIESGDKILITKNREEITPFIAKYILTELIDIKLKENKNSKKNRVNRLKFWYSLINKTDYTEFTCGKFCNNKESFRRDPDKMVVHMGYQLLNSIKGSNLLEKYAKLVSENKKEDVLKLQQSKTTQTLGLECSLIIQRSIERTKVGDIRGRLKTTTMSQKLSCGKNALFSKSVLTCDKQLDFADLVKPKGHVYLFLGYHKIDKKYYITTIEAVGGDVRGVGIFFREYPYENNEKLKCNLNKVWDSSKNRLKDPYPDQIYRYYQLR